VIDRVLAENAADRKPRVPAADDDRGEVFDGEPAAGAAVPLDHLDGYISRIGHDVVHGGALLRLRHQRLDVFL
jgi:hypothetical protein